MNTTYTQKMKAKRQTPEYKAWKKEVTAKLKAAHVQGLDISLLTTCPDSYQIALKIKNNSK